ncbi:hypothetical protein B2J93_5742 [Marssonina coronariae]|uniref:Uncharacterized protein n=1 Tax=Diplocarpon coronariae TaxID=2795749 RepID=A0A218Z099_9HELO|nr:hypothetical protein B2J93_5742 [Marssonina coronariae]
MHAKTLMQQPFSKASAASNPASSPASSSWCFAGGTRGTRIPSRGVPSDELSKLKPRFGHMYSRPADNGVISVGPLITLITLQQRYRTESSQKQPSVELVSATSMSTTSLQYRHSGSPIQHSNLPSPPQSIAHPLRAAGLRPGTRYCTSSYRRCVQLSSVESIRPGNTRVNAVKPPSSYDLLYDTRSPPGRAPCSATPMAQPCRISDGARAGQDTLALALVLAQQGGSGNTLVHPAVYGIVCTDHAQYGELFFVIWDTLGRVPDYTNGHLSA